MCVCVYVITTKHMKRCSMSFVIREFQIKTKMKYHYALIRIAKIWNTDNNKTGKGVDQQALIKC